jgi:RNA polymerase-binding transcription factor DksA
VRAELEAELARLVSVHDASLAALERLSQDSSIGAGDDQADAGAATFGREQELSIVANRADLIDQMRRAVARIDAGAYGLCESCGEQIPKARLQAFPAATLDVACKQREERR